MPTKEEILSALFPRTVDATYAGSGLARRSLAGALDAASLPGRAYSSLWHRYEEPMLQNMARTSATPGSLLAAGVAEGMARDPLTLISAPVGGLAGSGGRALASGVGSALMRRAAPVAADAVANAGLAALAQYGTEGRVDPGALAANAGLGVGMQGLGSAMAKMAPKARAAVMANPNFQKWFDGSKVADEAGNPLTVYHGTDQSFDSFDPAMQGALTGAESAKKGFFFASNPRNANFYAGIPSGKKAIEEISADIEKRSDLLSALEKRAISQQDEVDAIHDAWRKSGKVGPEPNDTAPLWSDYDAHKSSVNDDINTLLMSLKSSQLSPGSDIDRVFRRKTPNVMPSHLSMKNPLIHEQPGPYRDITYSALIDNAKVSGNDGVIIKNTSDPYAGDIYIPFDPRQIKSATGNRGTFDPNDPNITHLSSGQSAIGGAKALGGKYFRGLLNQDEKKEKR